MTLVRPDPILKTLPPGRMWVDVPESDWRLFNNWISEWSKNGLVKVISLEEEDDFRWYLFEVVAPALVVWLGPGVPTFADKSVFTKDDTVQKPPPMTIEESIREVAGAAGKATGIAAGGFASGAGDAATEGTKGFLGGLFSGGITKGVESVFWLGVFGTAAAVAWKVFKPFGKIKVF